MINIVTMKGETVVGWARSKKSFEELKELKKPYGEIYELTDKQYDEVSKSYDVTITDGKVKTSKGKRAEEAAQASREKLNRRLYKQIGQVLLVKSGKEAVGADTSVEDKQIELLKTQLNASK